MTENQKTKLLDNLRERYDFGPYPTGPNRIELALLSFARNMCRIGTGYYHKREIAKKVAENSENSEKMSDLQNRLKILEGGWTSGGRPLHQWFGNERESSTQYTVFFNDYQKTKKLLSRTMSRNEYEESLAQSLREGRSTKDTSEILEALRESLTTPYSQWGFLCYPRSENKDITQKEWQDYKHQHLNQSNFPRNVFGDIFKYFLKGSEWLLKD